VAIVVAVVLLFSAAETAQATLVRANALLTSDPLQIRGLGTTCIVAAASLVVMCISLLAGMYFCNLFYGDMVVCFSHETRAKRLRDFFASMKDIHVDAEFKVNQVGLSYDFVHTLKFHTK
jgi:hypothetical protein